MRSPSSIEVAELAPPTPRPTPPTQAGGVAASEAPAPQPPAAPSAEAPPSIAGAARASGGEPTSLVSSAEKSMLLSLTQVGMETQVARLEPAARAPNTPGIQECDEFAASAFGDSAEAPGVPIWEVDPYRAVLACKEAVQRYPDAVRFQYQYGRALHKAGRFRDALPWYEKAAAQGSPGAQTGLGLLYRNGRGVPQDYGRAFQWFQAAAARNHAYAQTHLGMMYLQGLYVPQDYQKALSWFSEAASQGEPYGQYYLGVMYANGLGVTRNLSEAYFWISLASRRGHAAAADSIDTVGDELSAAEREFVERRLASWTAARR